ncbi:MAG TPA: IPT/TIG domain-containing protein [Pantanalinema sp.]
MKIRSKTLLPVLILALAGCPLSGPAPTSPDGAAVASAIVPVEGRITTAGRVAQATFADVASGATLSLIDSLTGLSVATALSAADGRFYLAPSASSLVAARAYYLEASKGLAVGDQANRAGSAVARLRSVLLYQGGDWLSLTNAGVDGPIALSGGTTAVSLVAALRGLPLSALAGCLGADGLAFTPGATGISGPEYEKVLALVEEAIASDRDPIESVAYDATGATYGLKPGELLIYDAYSPSPASTGSTVTFSGQNFPAPRADTRLTIGEAPVAWSVSPDRRRLAVTIPADGHSGWLRLTQGASTWTGPFVEVRGTTGIWVGRGDASRLDGVGTQAGFNLPCSPGLDADGNVYLADAWNAVIRKITPAGVVTTVAGSGVKGFADGPAASAMFDNPISVAVARDGSLYVGEEFNNRIRKITPDGMVSTFAGGTQGNLDGVGTAAQFYRPDQLVLDAAGNLFVSDYGNHNIRKITPDGTVTTLAGSVPAAAGTTDGTGTAARFNQPFDIALDPQGNLFVADYGNHRIRKVTPAGVVTTVAGSTSGFVDGATSSAKFNQPAGLTFDRAGNLLVAERAGNVVRRVTPDGVVTTLVGTGAAGTRDGAALSATLHGPFDLWVDQAGRVFIIEEWGQRIRMYVP